MVDSRRKPFSEQLKKVRSDLDFSQSEVANALGLSQSTYSRAESGLGDLSMLEFDDLMSLYGISKEEFYLWDHTT